MKCFSIALALAILLIGAACTKGAAPLKLVAVAPINTKSASSRERARLLVELRLTSLIGAAQGESGSGSFDAVSRDWSAKIEDGQELRGLKVPEPFTKDGWLLMEMDWPNNASRIKQNSSIHTKLFEMVVEIRDVEDDLARRLREKASKAVRDYASKMEVKLVRWNQRLIDAGVDYSGGAPKLYGKMEILIDH